MYANIEDVWDNNTLPLFSTYNHYKEFDNDCGIKEYKSLNKRIDDNILIDESPISSNKMMMGTPIRRSKNNYNRFHQEQSVGTHDDRQRAKSPEKFKSFQHKIGYDIDFEPYQSDYQSDYQNDNYKFDEIKYESDKSNERKKKIIENFGTDIYEYTDPELPYVDDLYSDNEQNVSHKIKKPNCADYLKHILKCKKCYKIMQKKFGKKNKIIKNRQSFLDEFFTDDVKEILMVIVIGIFIILILDIFVRIIDKK